MSRNIPIMIIMGLIVITIAVLSNYLGSDYFVDKKPTIQEREIEKVIFKLIQYNDDAIQRQKLENERRIEELRNRQTGELDEAARAKIQAELDRLENERRALEQAEIDSKNEALEAKKRAEDSLLEISELKEKASSLGARYDNLNAEFDEYVTTLEEAVLENSDTEEQKSSVNTAFNTRRGLPFLESLVGDTQKEKSELINFYKNKLKSRSDSYEKGLTDIAKFINSSDFSAYKDNEGLVEARRSVADLTNRLDTFLKNRDAEANKRLRENLLSQEEELTLQKEEELLAKAAEVKEEVETKVTEREQLLKEEALKLQAEEHLAELERLREELSTLSEEDVQALLTQLEEKDLEIADLQAKLEEEINRVKVDPRIPAADKPLYTDWIHIPGLWKSGKTNLKYSGKQVDSIAWSRTKISDDTTISYNASFESGGENLIILHGNGRFKSWKDGTIVSIQDLGGNRAILTVTENGISENATTIYTNSIEASNGISGSYFYEISQGNLSIYFQGRNVLDKLPIKVGENKVIGFGNREAISKEYDINNLKIFKIK